MLPSAQAQQPHSVAGPPHAVTHVTLRRHIIGQGPAAHSPAGTVQPERQPNSARPSQIRFIVVV